MSRAAMKPKDRPTLTVTGDPLPKTPDALTPHEDRALAAEPVACWPGAPGTPLVHAAVEVQTWAGTLGVRREGARDGQTYIGYYLIAPSGFRYVSRAEALMLVVTEFAA